MGPDTILLRQVHPAFLQAGRPTSQVFRPTPKDHHRLSVDDGDRITAEAAWQRFTTGGSSSVGVLGVSCGECAALNLAVDADGEPYPEHVSIVFEGLSQREREARAKELRNRAVARGWLYGPQTAATA